MGELDRSANVTPFRAFVSDAIPSGFAPGDLLILLSVFGIISNPSE